MMEMTIDDVKTFFANHTFLEPEIWKIVVRSLY